MAAKDSTGSPGPPAGDGGVPWFYWVGPHFEGSCVSPWNHTDILPDKQGLFSIVKWSAEF